LVAVVPMLMVRPPFFRPLMFISHWPTEPSFEIAVPTIVDTPGLHVDSPLPFSICCDLKVPPFGSVPRLSPWKIHADGSGMYRFMQ
jgi:hypothetical protein